MTDASGTSRTIGFCVLLILGAALLLSHPYTGVRHDGILYAGDALARLRPGQFHDDLYFLFGSQGRFTLLPAFYAGLIATFGLGQGTMLGLALAYTLYLAAALYLVTAIAPPSLRAVCILSVTLGWTLYGGSRVFGYSEPFLTARSFAEPAVLLALGLQMRGRFVWALAALVVALTIHPLIAACGVVICWLMLAMQWPRWFWLAPLGLLSLGALGLAGVGQFSDVFAKYDDAWLALVQEANGHAFVSHWMPNDYGVIVFAVTCLWFAWRCTDRPAYRRLIVAAVIAGLGSTLVSLALVDIGLNPFFGKLQIWRALWVMQWLAIAGLPMVVVSLWRRDDAGRVGAALLTIGWMASFSIAVGLIGLLAVVLELFRARITLSRSTVRIVVGAAIVAAVTIAGQYEARVIKLGLLLDQSFKQIAAQALTMNIVIMVLACAFLFYVPKRSTRAAFLVATVTFIGSLVVWDQRADWVRNLESRPLDAHIWPGLVEPEAKVYWYRDMIAPWILLGHANYYTQQQGSGAVFSRAMIVELEKRRKVASVLELQEQICRMMNNLNENARSCEPDTEAVRTICTDGGVDYVVLQSSPDGAKQIAEFSTGVVENGYEKKFFLYRCSALKPR